MIATEVAKAIDGLLRELDLRIEAVRAGNAAPELPQSLPNLLSRRKLAIVHTVFENGCLAGSSQRKKQLISAVAQQRGCLNTLAT